jgi:hypothetical protein
LADVNYHVRKGRIERVVQLADELTTYFDPERRGIRKLRSTASGRVCGLNPLPLFHSHSNLPFTVEGGRYHSRNVAIGYK